MSGDVITKKAIVAVSFGTTHRDARRAIENVERALTAAFPERDFYRAFTSGMVARRILREEGLAIPNPAELAEQLLARGYKDVIFQSLHVIAGSEFDKLTEQLAPYRAEFASLAVGKPLLWDAEDYAEVARALTERMPPRESEAVVFMGHGSEHPMNAAYSQLENTLRAMGRERAYIGTVEGFPALSYIVSRLARHSVRRVRLAPLMITAGEHVKNDLNGASPDSWASQLRSAGYAVEVDTTGLGELDAIAELFAKHAAAHCL
ncbi:MAG: sirohydrochlorin cobaltochelatase [Oscillospiraceae bacterium]|jgi:sirohydrochlorin cobaltochelatase|nr:sirohydrochlorin cobaltochelatase [Oscillospiraceae bacterium]